MNIDASRALVPIQTAIHAIAAVENKEISRFRHHDSDREGVIFMGYGKDGVDGNYGPYGEKLKKEMITGGIVDIYV